MRQDKLENLLVITWLTFMLGVGCLGAYVVQNWNNPSYQLVEMGLKLIGIGGGTSLIIALIIKGNLAPTEEET